MGCHDQRVTASPASKGPDTLVGSPGYSLTTHRTYRWVAMLAHIHLGKGAGVAHTHHLHSEVAEEVNDVQGLWTQADDEDEGGNDGTQELLQDEDLSTEMIGSVQASECQKTHNPQTSP